MESSQTLYRVFLQGVATLLIDSVHFRTSCPNSGGPGTVLSWAHGLETCPFSLVRPSPILPSFFLARFLHFLFQPLLFSPFLSDQSFTHLPAPSPLPSTPSRSFLSACLTSQRPPPPLPSNPPAVLQSPLLLLIKPREIGCPRPNNPWGCKAWRPLSPFLAHPPILRRTHLTASEPAIVLPCVSFASLSPQPLLRFFLSTFLLLSSGDDTLTFYTRRVDCCKT